MRKPLGWLARRHEAQVLSSLADLCRAGLALLARSRIKHYCRQGAGSALTTGCAHVACYLQVLTGRLGLTGLQDSGAGLSSASEASTRPGRRCACPPVVRGQPGDWFRCASAAMYFSIGQELPAGCRQAQRLLRVRRSCPAAC